MPESPLERRLRDIRANVEEHYEPIGDVTPFVSIGCNGCGRVETHVLVEGEIPEAELEKLAVGWTVSTERPYHDLCPECS